MHKSLSKWPWSTAKKHQLYKFYLLQGYAAV